MSINKVLRNINKKYTNSRIETDLGSRPSPHREKLLNNKETDKIMFLENIFTFGTAEKISSKGTPAPLLARGEEPKVSVDFFSPSSISIEKLEEEARIGEEPTQICKLIFFHSTKTRGDKKSGKKKNERERERE